MTWFETHEVYDYVDHVETALEEWTLNRNKMLLEQAELSRLSLKLNRDIACDSQSSKGILLCEICDHIQECQNCIAERLKS